MAERPRREALGSLSQGRAENGLRRASPSLQLAHPFSKAFKASALKSNHLFLCSGLLWRHSRPLNFKLSNALQLPCVMQQCFRAPVLDTGLSLLLPVTQVKALSLAPAASTVRRAIATKISQPRWKSTVRKPEMLLRGHTVFGQRHHGNFHYTEWHKDSHLTSKQVSPQSTNPE